MKIVFNLSTPAINFAICYWLFAFCSNHPVGSVRLRRTTDTCVFQLSRETTRVSPTFPSGFIPDAVSFASCYKLPATCYLFSFFLLPFYVNVGIGPSDDPSINCLTTGSVVFFVSSGVPVNTIFPSYSIAIRSAIL